MRLSRSARQGRLLADCLARIEAGADRDAVLAELPAERRAELAGMLATAEALRALPPRPLRPAFRRALEAELARLERAAPPPAAAVPNPGAARDRRALPRLAAAAIAGLAILAVGIFAAASGRIGPIGGFGPDLVGRGESTSNQAGRPVPPLAARGGPPATPVARVLRPERWKAALALAQGDATAHDAADPAGAAPDPALGPAARDGEPSGHPALAPASPSPPTPSPEPTALPTNALATRPERHRDPEPELPPSPEASPTPPPDASGTPPPLGPFVVAGLVKRLTADPEGEPLGAVRVELYRIDETGDCALGLPGPLVAATTSDAGGGYRFEGVEAGSYLVAALREREPGNPDCLPRRWHARGAPALADACAALPSAFRLDEETPGREAGQIHLLFDPAAICRAGTAGD